MSSLYIHIPFCRSRCAYCAFYSEVYEANKEFVEPYFKRLMAEVTHCVSLNPHGFDTVYLGGGNPGLLGVDRLLELLRLIHSVGKPREVTVEMNPETLSEECFVLFEEGLLSRLSIGIQSMNDRFLKRLGRNTSARINQRALTRAEQIRLRYGIEITFDLIIAIPNQTIEDVRKDIDSVLGICSANHLSLYALTVEEGTRLYEEGGPVMGEDEQATLLYGVWGYLESIGFEHYEVSNFACGNHYSQHNLVYWNLGSYWGLGSSAASTQIEGANLIHYVQGQSLSEYALGDVGSGYEREELTLSERIEEEVMVRLRTKWGLDKESFHQRYGIRFSELFSPVIESLDDSWYSATSQFFVLTEIGFMVLDTILLRFFEQIAEALDRH